MAAPLHAAGIKGMASRSTLHGSALPPPYDPGAGSGRRQLTPGARLTEAFPPYALGYEAAASAPDSGPAVDMAPVEGIGAPAAVSMSSDSLHELRAAISRQVKGSTARVAAAFAKRDQARQGKLSPADFAAAVRELGVPIDTRQMHGLQSGSADLSSGTIDYLAFVASLEPHLGWAAAEAGLGVAEMPGSDAVRTKLDQRRLFGAHAQTPRSQVRIAHAQTPRSQVRIGAGDGAEGGEPPQLHEHAAFAAAAGVGAERRGADTNGRKLHLPAEALPSLSNSQTANQLIFALGKQSGVDRTTARCAASMSPDEMR